MARIKQLSENLINQIAAGEVIERPASVVKELVENSIDAGATKISIEIANDCRDIRIADNGCGIHPDDIMLAFSKHATSKIRNDSDLFDIKTLGFRGEALASIISISKLTCTTRTKDFETGIKVKCENSEVKQVQTGCAVGTIMEIRDLFYNVPVRLKFLRNPNTELSYIQEILQSLALSETKISFELKKNNKIMLKTTGQGDLLHAIKEVYSSEVTSYLKPVLKTDEEAGLKVSGMVSTPDYTRASKKSYHLFINSRSVKCPIMQKAIDTAYKTLIANHKYPFVVLNLEIPNQDIDVNVHPTKKEVRYKNPNQIFNLIMSAVNAGLSNWTEDENAHMNSEYGNSNETETKTSDNSGVLTLKPTDYETDTDNDEDSIFFEQQQISSMKEDILPMMNPSSLTDDEGTNRKEDLIIGQYKNTYILIEREEGLEIVDQHIAEERYLYEKLKSEKQIASQILFVSDVVEVNASDMALINEYLDKFERFGYGIEVLNEKELIFRKVPTMIAKVNPKDILADVLENIEGNIDQLEEKILITTACKASVKAGQKLSMWQMQEIIRKWRSTKMPYTCPHGRPVSHIIDHKELAGFFQRQK